MKPETTLLCTKHLAVHIGDILVCNDLNLEIRDGSCWGVLGANGIGKTTLLHTLAGLRPAYNGHILLDGREINSLPRKEVARIAGLLFQTEEAGFPASLFEAVLSGRHPHLGRWAWETRKDLELAQQAIDRVGLAGMEARSVATLSGGERRRMDIATLLVQAPRIALLDEPNNHLDPGQQVGMMEILRSEFTGPGRCTIMVLHDINLAVRFCDNLLFLQGDGEWVAGPTEKISTEENLSRLYGYPMRRITDETGYCVLPD